MSKARRAKEIEKWREDLTRNRERLRQMRALPSYKHGWIPFTKKSGEPSKLPICGEPSKRKPSSRKAGTP